MSAKPGKLRVSRKGKHLAVIDAVEFEFFDTGIGISEQNQANMFQLFGKVNQKNKSINKQGVGLGLYITKQLVAELGGLIRFESIEGSFTKFIVTIPVLKKFRVSAAKAPWFKKNFGITSRMDKEGRIETERQRLNCLGDVCLMPGAERSFEVMLDDLSDFDIEEYSKGLNCSKD